MRKLQALITFSIILAYTCLAVVVYFMNELVNERDNHQAIMYDMKIIIEDNDKATKEIFDYVTDLKKNWIKVY